MPTVPNQSTLSEIPCQTENSFVRVGGKGSGVSLYTHHLVLNPSCTGSGMWQRKTVSCKQPLPDHKPSVMASTGKRQQPFSCRTHAFAIIFTLFVACPALVNGQSKFHRRLYFLMSNLRVESSLLTEILSISSKTW